MDQVESTPPAHPLARPDGAPGARNGLFNRALAKAPSMRFGSAIEMGEAFRAAFGLPSAPAWRAQGGIAQVAGIGAQDPARAQRLATLRDVVKQEYRTQPIPQRAAPPVPR